MNEQKIRKLQKKIRARSLHKTVLEQDIILGTHAIYEIEFNPLLVVQRRKQDLIC